jgi:hypothetical protein
VTTRPCVHLTVEPVHLLTGELVAQVCEGCWAQLPPSWGCGDCGYVDVPTLGEAWPARIMAWPCLIHRVP